MSDSVHVGMTQETDIDTDQDLRDVFRLMYDEEDDWAFDEEEHPPLNTLVPDLELPLVDVAAEEDQYLTQAYSRKRFRTQLDALIPSQSQSDKKRQRRIFPSPPTSIRYHPSIDPLPPLPSMGSYEPFSPLTFLSRLRTFHPSLYSPFYPQTISPERLVMNGWFCSARDAMECGQCGAKWGVRGLEDIRDGRVREEIARRLGMGMGDRHGRGCPRRMLSCPEGMMGKLRNTLHPPISSNIAQLSQSLSGIPDIKLKSRLDEKQTNHLVHALSRYTPTAPDSRAAELALFGWSPHPLSTEIVQCRICQRRLGLWAFKDTSDSSGNRIASQKAGLDPVGEHVPWCPLSVEGWWAQCALLKGGRGNVGDVVVSKGVKRRKWLIKAGGK